MDCKKCKEGLIHFQYYEGSVIKEGTKLCDCEMGRWALSMPKNKRLMKAFVMTLVGD